MGEWELVPPSDNTPLFIERPSDFIVIEPYLFVDRPTEYGVPFVAIEIWTKQIRPTYSVLLNVYNSEMKLRLVLVQLLKMTTEPWELIIVLDGCTDKSLEVVKSTWKSFATWPKCPYDLNEVDERYVWQSGQHLDSSQGDIGRECLFQPSSLVHLRVIVVPKVGLFATASDNLKMKNAVGKYFILVDDDQLMTVHEWNIKLSWPLRRWGDVFSASARCAHSFLDGKEGGPYAGTKCKNSLNLQGITKKERCFFFVRDSGNRGPLILDASMVRQSGYMDEINHLGVITQNCDHELNSRAFARFGWVSGSVAIDYTEERGFRSPTTPEHNRQVDRYIDWWRQRQANFNRVIYATPFAHLQSEHNEDRAIHDVSFHPRCN